MTTSVGIDLGTTYSCVIHHDGNGNESIVPSIDGGDLTPSVVYFGDEALVGSEAKAQLKDDPDNVVVGIKRHMGTDYPMEFGGQRLTPEGISGLILRHLAADAAAALQVSISDLRAVITVPAYFGVTEKEATEAASVVAGLNCLELLAEPVAAAYAYGLDSEPNVTSVVFDLGGGTFDVAIVGMHQGIPRVWAVDGETQLGGLDWDLRIQDILWAQVDELPDADELRYSENVIGQIEATAERLKRALTGRDQVTERIRLRGNTIELVLTRDQFEERTRDLVLKTLDTTSRAIKMSGAQGAPTVGQVILVGGSTRMPMIRSSLAEHLKVPVKLADPDKAVARGAAMLAAKLVKQSNRGLVPANERIGTVLSRSLGLLTYSSQDPWREEPYISHMLVANLPLPIVKEEIVVATIADKQASAKIQIYEQGGAICSEEVADNRLVLEGEVLGIPPQPAGSPLSLVISVSIDGRITLGARIFGSTALAVEAFMHGVLDDAEVADQTRVISGLKLMAR